MKERYFSCLDSLLPLSDHRGQDTGCFLNANYRTYFACQYQQNRWHYSEVHDHLYHLYRPYHLYRLYHLCRLLNPVVLVPPSDLVDPWHLFHPSVHKDLVVPLGLCHPSVQEDPRGQRTPWARRTHFSTFSHRLASSTYLAVNIHHYISSSKFFSLILGACHSKRKNIFYRWRDLKRHDPHLSRLQFVCFLLEEI